MWGGVGVGGWAGGRVSVSLCGWMSVSLCVSILTVSVTVSV